MGKAEMIDKLNEILRWEWTGVAQYAQAGFVVSGVWREVYSKMLQHGLEFESGAVKHYTEALQMCDDRALTVLLEDILLEEQDGVDHLEKLLREQKTAAKGSVASKAG